MSFAAAGSAPAGEATGKPRLRLRMPLAVKFAGAVVGLVVLVLIVNGAVNLWLSYGEAKRAALDLQVEQAQAASERIDQFVSEIENQIGWTTRAEWRRIAREQQRYDFIRLLRQAPAITELYYLDGQGLEQLKVSRLEPDSVASRVDHSGEPRFTEAVATGTWFGPVYFRRGSEPYMTIGMAHAGRAPGVTVAEVNLKLIWDVINRIRVGETGYAYVVGPNGKLIAHPDMSLVLRETDMNSLPQVASALAASGGAADVNNAAVAEDLEGDRVLTAYARIPRLGWTVFVQSPVAEALAPVYTLLAQSGLLLAVGLLLAAIVGTLLARRMVVPIQRLQAGAERLGEGDLSQRIAIRTGDEIETLADRFNVMAGRIQESHETLEARVEERTRDLDEALHQQTATADVLKVISRSAFDLDAVLTTLIRSAIELCDAKRGVIWLRRGEQLFLAAHVNYPAEWVAAVQDSPITPSADAVTTSGLAAFTGEVVHVEDTPNDPRFRSLAAHKLGDYRAGLAVPLKREGRVEGVISLARPEARLFTDRQVALVQTFADQAVIAIENARLFEAVQARTAELQESLEYQTATGDVLNIISRSPAELQPVLNAIVQTAARLCSAEYAFILKAVDGMCHLAAANNVELAHIQFLSRNSVPIDRASIAGRVALERRTIHVLDVLADPDFKRLDWQAVGRQRTVLGVPLLREGALLGVIILARTAVEPFTDKQVELVATFADQAVIAIENVRLFEEVQARTRELQESLEFQTATGDVLNVISRSPNDLQPVLDTIVKTAHDLCQAQFTLFFQRGADGLYHLAASRNAEGEFLDWLKSHPIAAGDGTATGLAADDKQTVHLPDALADPRFTDLRRQARSKARTQLAVPLMRSGVAIGVIFLARTEVKPFTDRQVDLVTTFADQAIIAINNVGLFEEVQTRTAELSESLRQQTATADVLKAISRSTFDLQPVLDALVESAAKLCEADKGVIFKRDGDLYRWSANYGNPPELEAFAKAHPFVPGRYAVTSRVALEARTLHVTDVLADPEYGATQYQKLGGYRTILCVPILREGAPVGVFALTRSEVRDFTLRQIELVETFADQAGIAIENVRLFDEVQAKTRDLEEALTFQKATGDVLEVIGRSASKLQPVLDAIVNTAADLCRADMSVMRLVKDGAFHHAASGSRNDSALMRHSRDNSVLPFDRTSIAGRVGLEARTIHVHDVTADPEYTFLSGLDGSSVRTALGVPLLRDERVVGVIILLRKRVNPFTERQIALVQTFADQAVIAIGNVRLFEEVQARTQELSRSLEDLRTAQDRLVQTEKLASLGQLTAGIAHEIKNPLNFVNNFSALSRELVDELREALEAAPLDNKARAEVAELTGMLKGNLEKVVQHGKRADSIVKNMLLHSREGSGEHRPVDINAVVEESLNLAYHGARAEKQGFNITLEKSLDPEAGEVDLFPQEITRVLLNLISNGFYATTKRNAEANGAPYEPTLSASTRNLGDRVEIRIRDNGTGVPAEVREKMFNPFFTTKPAGEGTGLGLSLSHDIVVKQHAGTIEMETELGAFTEFRIVLPRGAASIAGARKEQAA